MAHKYILHDGQLIFGNVEYHYELIGLLRQREKVEGGGRFHWDAEKKVVYFYGSSTDFGAVTKERFFEAWENSLISPAWDDCKIIFSAREYLSDVLADVKPQNE